MSFVLVPKCQCGRPAVPTHCPSCGSTNIYTARRLNIQYIDTETATIKTAKGFVCRRGGHEFNTQDPCEAPMFENTTMRERRLKDDAMDRVKKLYADALVRGGKEELRRVQMDINRRLLSNHNDLAAALDDLSKSAPAEPVPEEVVQPNPNINPETGQWEDNWPPKD